MGNRIDSLAARRAYEVTGYELHTDRPEIGLQVFAKEVGGGHGIMAKCFLGRAGKPAWFYRFRNEAEFAAYVARQIASREQSLEYKAQAKAKRAVGVEVAVGDVFECSWGYDQTNIDYYQVTRVVSDKTIEIRKIAGMVWETGWLQGRSVPSTDAFIGPAMVKRVRAVGDGGAAVRIASYANAYRMKPVIEGTPLYASSAWSAYH